MENASKALIIAGAILISILIIALGVFIYQKAAGAGQDLGGLDETKIQSVNQKFENYEGMQSGTDVKALIDLVRTNNNAYDASDNRTITIKGLTGSSLSEMKNSIVEGSKYEVSIPTTDGYYTDGPSKGYVKTINITKK